MTRPRELLRNCGATARLCAMNVPMIGTMKVFLGPDDERPKTKR
jgi:hypothetical protein